jgi:hypothetical protein
MRAVVVSNWLRGHGPVDGVRHDDAELTEWQGDDHGPRVTGDEGSLLGSGGVVEDP